MAGRTSTILTPNSAQNLYTNETNGAVVCTVNGVSTVSTENPPFSLKLSADNNVSLNYSQLVFTAPTSYQARVISIDKPNSGLYPFYRPSQGMGTIGGSDGTSYVQTSTSANYVHKYWSQLEPYMLTNPTEYGNALGECRYAGAHSNTNYWVKDIRTKLASLPGLFNGATNAWSTSGYDYSQSFNYGNAGSVMDFHTGVWISWHTNAYMSCGRYTSSGGSQHADRTSDSYYYQITGSDYNPTSYFNNTNNSPFACADGGVIVNNFVAPSNTSLSYVVIIPVRSIFTGGTLPSNKFQDNPINDSQWNNFISSSSSWNCYFNTAAHSFQWMKYNKTEDLYYFCFKGASAELSGIYSFTWPQMSRSVNSAYGLTGGGPSNSDPFTFTGATTWKRVANYPLSDTTAEMSMPAKIGPDLWVSHAGVVPYYSTDLKTWNAESSYFTGTLSEFNFIEQDAATNSFYGTVGTSSIKQPITGFSTILGGDLEASTPVGNYSRNGIVLSKGDSIYGENSSKTASISTTVMFAEI
jgi:hypothetical protein